MKKTIETLAGDTIGSAYTFPVYQFGEVDDCSAPSAYLQAALHANERPGVVVLHELMRLLQGADADGRIRGRITIVPTANPIGETQHLFHRHEGRFDLGSRTNFNRSFPLLEAATPSAVTQLADFSEDRMASAVDRLKARLLSMALTHEIVLDLHCDTESLPYLYIPRSVWPGAADLAGALSAAAVILGEDHSGGAFEDAAIYPWVRSGGDAHLRRRVVSTVELRGLRDVSLQYAQSDATSLYRFLVGRGLIDDTMIVQTQVWSSDTTDITHVEIVRSPCPGTVLFHVEPGQLLAKGQEVATVISTPGDPAGDQIVRTPQSGLVLTRSLDRLAQPGDQLIKLLGSEKSAEAKTGPLEN